MKKIIVNSYAFMIAGIIWSVVCGYLTLGNGGEYRDIGLVVKMMGMDLLIVWLYFMQKFTINEIKASMEDKKEQR